MFGDVQVNTNKIEIVQEDLVWGYRGIIARRDQIHDLTCRGFEQDAVVWVMKYVTNALILGHQYNARGRGDVW